MSSSLRDQLLKAGLGTKKPKKKTTQKQNKKATNNPTTSPKPKAKKRKKPASDLANFYQQRAQQENKEKQEAEKKRREVAKLKKEQRRKVSLLIRQHKLDNTQAEIRYNFVVNTTIKYIFVTEAQQKQLENGELAITFHTGQSCLIPQEVGHQILHIMPNKFVLFQEPEQVNSQSE